MARTLDRPSPSEVIDDGTLGSSIRRFRTVFTGDLAYHVRRPLFIVWVLILVFAGLGNVHRGGEDPVGRRDGRRHQGVRHLRVRRRDAARAS